MQDRIEYIFKAVLGSNISATNAEIMHLTNASE